MPPLSSVAITVEERTAYTHIINALGFASTIYLGRGTGSRILERVIEIQPGEDVLYGIVGNSRPVHKGEVERFSVAVIRMPVRTQPTAEEGDPSHRLEKQLVAAFRKAGTKGLNRTAVHSLFRNNLPATVRESLLTKMIEGGIIAALPRGKHNEQRFVWVQPGATGSAPTAHRQGWAKRIARFGPSGASPEGLARRKAAYYRALAVKKAEAKKTIGPYIAKKAE